MKNFSFSCGEVKSNFMSAMGMTEEMIEQYSKITANATPLAMIGSAQHIANAVAFLASDDSAFITGITLIADGGLHLSHYNNSISD
jgi:3-oxoacyl-[acyl-carrier protein] reductase